MSEQSDNYLIKLFKGDVPLVITFWVFYVVVGAIVSFIPSFPVNLVVGVYFTIALWNSAGKYKGAAIWRKLSRILAVLSIIVFVLMTTILGLETLGIIEIPAEVESL
ncbi:MAG: hypothetical protein ACNYPG_03000 [Candidatus Porifericomitaceae bacterium WSBS_2022_MAG_OTU9]